MKFRSVKSTVGILFCPVASIFILQLALVLLPGCGSEAPEPDLSSDIVLDHPGTVTSSLVTGFTVLPAPPDTVRLRWSGEGPAEVNEQMVLPGDSVSQGDTLMILTETLRLVELERVAMEVEMALAALEVIPGDSLLQIRLDSLTAVSDSLSTLSSVPLLSPLAGRIHLIPEQNGDTVLPGTILVTLTSGPGTLFLAAPPPGVVMDRWPENPGEMTLIETGPESAVYSGVGGLVDADFSMVRSVSRNALFEEDLRVLMISPDGDSLEVIRAGTSESDVIVIFPENTDRTEFITWGN